MNPLEWGPWLYGKYFAHHNAAWGYVFACSIGVIVAVVAWTQIKDKYEDDHPKSASVQPTSHIEPFTLATLFATDFPNLMKLIKDSGFTMGGVHVPIKEQEYLDIVGRSKFAGFYIPSSPYTFKICREISLHAQDYMKEIEQDRTVDFSFDAGETSSAMKDFVFSGRVYIYHEQSLTLKEKTDLVEDFKRNNFDVQLFGTAYLNDVAMQRRLKNAEGK
jgi:hypothetical protein